jgi:hypothetical protein
MSLVTGNYIPHACLSRAAEFAEHRSFNRKAYVGIIENNKRCISPKFHTDTFQRARSKFSQHLADVSRSSETDFANERIRRQFGRGLPIFGWTHLDESWRDTSLHR